MPHFQGVAFTPPRRFPTANEHCVLYEVSAVISKQRFNSKCGYTQLQRGLFLLTQSLNVAVLRIIRPFASTMNLFSCCIECIVKEFVEA